VEVNGKDRLPEDPPWKEGFIGGTTLGPQVQLTDEQGKKKRGQAVMVCEKSQEGRLGVHAAIKTLRRKLEEFGNRTQTGPRFNLRARGGGTPKKRGGYNTRKPRRGSRKEAGRVGYGIKGGEGKAEVCSTLQVECGM